VKILITNDDGIYADGLWALREAMAHLGEVHVVAPDRPRSAAGHAITLHKPLRLRKVTLASGACGWCTNGTPADCVVLAISSVMGRPDLVVSGINEGPNLGEDLTYSGTVSAAMEATLCGLPSFSISVAGEQVEDFGPAARFGAKLAKAIAEHALPVDTFLNVNVPPLPEEKITSVEITRQGRRRYQGKIEKRLDPSGREYFWVLGDVEHLDSEGGTDVEAVAAGRVSVTPIQLDLTHHSFIGELKAWKLTP
jgi:5'-nucleotidase